MSQRQGGSGQAGREKQRIVLSEKFSARGGIAGWVFVQKLLSVPESLAKLYGLAWRDKPSG